MNQFLRYIIAGIANSLVGYSVIFGCMYLARMSPETSNTAGYVIGLIVSYVLNRNYTFNSTQEKRTEIVRFLAVFAVAYVLNFVALLILIHQFDMHKGVSQVVAGVVYVIAAYLMNKYYVFKIPNAG